MVVNNNIGILPEDFVRVSDWRKLKEVAGDNSFVKIVRERYVSRKNDDELEKLWKKSESRLDSLIEMDKSNGRISKILRWSGFTKLMTLKNLIILSSTRDEINERLMKVEREAMGILKIVYNDDGNHLYLLQNSSSNQQEVNVVYNWNGDVRLPIIFHPANGEYQCHPHIIMGGTKEDISEATIKRKNILREQEEELNDIESHYPGFKNMIWNRLQKLHRIGEMQEEKEKYDLGLINKGLYRFCSHLQHYSLERMLKCHTFSKYINSQDYESKTRFAKFKKHAKKFLYVVHNSLDDLMVYTKVLFSPIKYTTKPI